jgi:CRP/FNR family transcriptional regulator
VAASFIVARFIVDRWRRSRRCRPACLFAAVQTPVARALNLEGYCPWSAPMPVALRQRAIEVPAKVVHLAAALIALPMPACTRCHLWQLCTPCAPTAQRPRSTGGVAFARRRLAIGEVLFNQGDAFHAVYAVRSGSLKSTVAMPAGRSQVSGFLFAGDVMALDAMASAQHASTVTAIEDTQVCAVSYPELLGAMKGHLLLQRGFSRQLSLEMVRASRLLLVLGRMSAQERLATFLLDLSCRFRDRGHSAREFNLRMTRAEIGSYLGLTLETVSRTLSVFQQQGLLAVEHKHIRFLDLESFARRFEAVLQG